LSDLPTTSNFANDHEQNRCDDEEVHQRIQEHPVVDRRRARLLCAFNVGNVPAPRTTKKLEKSTPPKILPDRRHEDVVDQRRHDRPERNAEDDTDRQFDGVALDHEASFLPFSRHPVASSRVRRVDSNVGPY